MTKVLLNVRQVKDGAATASHGKCFTGWKMEEGKVGKDKQMEMNMSIFKRKRYYTRSIRDTMQSSEAQYFTYTLARQITNFTEARAHLSTDQLQREGGEVQISIRKLCWRHMHFSGPTRDMKRINGEIL